jgi:hypothetical protein
MGTTDEECTAVPMKHMAAGIVYELTMLDAATTHAAGLLTYVVVEWYNTAVGLFNLSIIVDCGTSCVQYGGTLVDPCACEMCAAGFAAHEHGTYKYIGRLCRVR